MADRKAVKRTVKKNTAALGRALGVQEVIDRLHEFRMRREDKKKIEAMLPKMQQELIVALREIDPNNNGVTFDPSDSGHGTAFIQQNDPSEYWDQEAAVQWLKQDAALWRACSSRVFDPVKFEAEVAAGNITAAQAAKFKKTGNPPAAFIRFGKSKPSSLS